MYLITESVGEIRVSQKKRPHCAYHPHVLQSHILGLASGGRYSWAMSGFTCAVGQTCSSGLVMKGSVPAAQRAPATALTIDVLSLAIVTTHNFRSFHSQPLLSKKCASYFSRLFTQSRISEPERAGSRSKPKEELHREDASVNSHGSDTQPFSLPHS